ncbi:autotransporter-associated beta strand repeat-containing protein, partial [Variovorax sp. JS1663]|uniref:autotransporter-associated beta strand repeat-containing protein n=1 Tax=Variovorax sp. JS1663 TaxID=1851577 RepID=UPI001864B15D
MNRTHRSLWNATLGAWVAAPENARARGKPGGSVSRIARACALTTAVESRALELPNARSAFAGVIGSIVLLGLNAATIFPAHAQFVSLDGGSGGCGTVGCQAVPGGAGGTSAAPDGEDGGRRGGIAGSGGSGGGGGGVSLSTGIGGNGGAGSGGGGSSGGSGGSGGSVGSSTQRVITTPLAGTAGGDGSSTTDAGGGGGGGGGGFGLVLAGNDPASNVSEIVGGNGGAGGSGGAEVIFASTFIGATGGGGAGGGAVLLTGATSFTNSGSMSGGHGGATSPELLFRGSDDATNVTGGGDGGMGIALTGGGAINNSRSISGGAGGAGNYLAGSDYVPLGGEGGAGVLLTSGGTVLNTGDIQGGAGGSADPAAENGVHGAGGAGVVATGNVVITNANSISGGLSGDGSTRANAIDLSGGNNRLILRSGYSFAGNVVSTSGATNGGDTLVLGGDENPPASFNVSNIVANLPAVYANTQYVGFSNFAKTGASTWVLTGNGATGLNWSIAEGTLQGDTGTFAGNISFAPASASSTPGVAFDQSTVGNAVYDGVISGNGSFTLTGGILTLAGVNTYTGGTTVNGYLIGGTTSFGSGAIAINNGSGLQVEQPLGTEASLTNIITGNGALTKTGNGTLALTGLNTYTGGTRIEEGALSISADQNLGDRSGELSLGSDTTLRNTAAIIMERSIGLNFAVTFQTDADLTLNGIISGTAGHLIKTGGGTLTLTGENEYTRGATLSEGTLSISSDANLGTPNGMLTFQGGTLRTTADFTMNRGTFIDSQGGTIETLTGTTLTQQGVIEGTGALIKTGDGTLTLFGTNTYEGGTTVSAGTLAGSANSFGISGIINNAILLIDQSTDGNLSNDISGSGALTKTGNGILRLSGQNTYSGATTVNAGTLQAAMSDRAFGIGSAVTVNDTATLDLNDLDQTIGSLSGAGVVLLGSGSLTSGSKNTDTLFSGSISGSGSLTKTGAGTLTLTGTNTYAGGTTINAGTLAGSAGSFGSGAIANNAALLIE